MTPHVVGFIFARGGSKGVPRKNIRLLAGKPLIAYAIEVGLESSLVDRLIVSTDDEEIAAVAKQYGAEVPFIRPHELARDDSPEWLSWQHAIRTVNEQSARVDVFVSIPTTAPLRQVEDVDNAINRLINTNADIVIAVTPASNNPYFNMVIKDAAGNAELLMDAKGEISRRQDAPDIYDITTAVYAGRPAFILQADHMFAGKVKTIVLPQKRALDIDTEWDFHVADCILRQRLSSSREGISHEDA